MKGAGKLAGAAFKEMRKQAPMPHKKSVVAAFVVAFCFGCLGYGIYTQDWSAAMWLFVTTIILFFMIPGLGMVVAGLLCACMCAFRVHESNVKGGHV